MDLHDPVSKNFRWGEFLGWGTDIDSVPGYIMLNVEALARDILQPLRDGIGKPIFITSGWRPFSRRTETGNISDHLSARAVDFYVISTKDEGWEINTYEAFHWLRVHKLSQVGQLILEDRRQYYKNPYKLWVHVSLPSDLHPGHSDVNQLLVTYEPGNYEPYSKEALG